MIPPAQSAVEFSKFEGIDARLSRVSLALDARRAPIDHKRRDRLANTRVARDRASTRRRMAYDSRAREEAV
jgi:hypothetical protein